MPVEIINSCYELTYLAVFDLQEIQQKQAPTVVIVQHG